MTPRRSDLDVGIRRSWRHVPGTDQRRSRRSRLEPLPCKVGEWTVVSNIDLRWITTITAIGHFRPSSGRSPFAGIGFINHVDERSRVVMMTSYVLGLHLSPEVEAFYEAVAAHTAGRRQPANVPARAADTGEANPPDLPIRTRRRFESISEE